MNLTTEVYSNCLSLASAWNVPLWAALMTMLLPVQGPQSWCKRLIRLVEFLEPAQPLLHKDYPLLKAELEATRGRMVDRLEESWQLPVIGELANQRAPPAPLAPQEYLAHLAEGLR